MILLSIQLKFFLFFKTTQFMIKTAQTWIAYITSPPNYLIYKFQISYNYLYIITTCKIRFNAQKIMKKFFFFLEFQTILQTVQINMNNWVKKYSNLLTNFIDNTFLPLLDGKSAQSLIIIDQWMKLKNILAQTCETECNELSLAKIQKFINQSRSKPNTPAILKINNSNLISTTSKIISNGNSNSNSNSNSNKNANPLPNTNSHQKNNGQKNKPQANSPLYQNDSKRFNLGEGSRKLDFGQQKKSGKNDSSVRQTLDSFNNPISPIQYKEGDKIESKLSIESLEGLLSSFKKLCTNIENNHKRLVTERENISY